MSHRPRACCEVAVSSLLQYWWESNPYAQWLLTYPHMHVACSSSFSNLPRAKPQLLAKSRLTIQDSTKWRLNSNVLFPNSPLRTGLLVYCLIDWAIRNVYVYIYIHDFIYIVHVSYNGFDSQVSCFWPSFSSDLWLWWICFWAFWWRPGTEWGQIVFFTTLVFQRCPQCTAMLVSFFSVWKQWKYQQTC